MIFLNYNVLSHPSLPLPLCLSILFSSLSSLSLCPPSPSLPLPLSLPLSVCPSDPLSISLYFCLSLCLSPSLFSLSPLSPPSLPLFYPYLSLFLSIPSRLCTLIKFLLSLFDNNVLRFPFHNASRCKIKWRTF